MNSCVILAGKTRSTLPLIIIILISSNITTVTIAVDLTVLGPGIKRSHSLRRIIVHLLLKALRPQHIKNNMHLKAIMQVGIKNKVPIMEEAIGTQVMQIKHSQAVNSYHIALHNPQARIHTINLHSAESEYFDCLLVSL